MLLASLLLSARRTALAQGVTAQVSGVVVDAGGGVVPGATVTITNAETNGRREADDGRPTAGSRSWTCSPDTYERQRRT